MEALKQLKGFNFWTQEVDYKIPHTIQNILGIKKSPNGYSLHMTDCEGASCGNACSGSSCSAAGACSSGCSNE